MAQLLLFIGRTSVEVVRGWILLHMSTRINISLVSDFFIKLMRLPIAFFDVRMTGDILQRINDIKLLQNDYKEFDSIMDQIIMMVLKYDEDNCYTALRRKIFYNFFNINCNFLDYSLNSKNTFDYVEVLRIFNTQLIKFLNIYKGLILKALK